MWEKPLPSLEGLTAWEWGPVQLKSSAPTQDHLKGAPYPSQEKSTVPLAQVLGDVNGPFLLPGFSLPGGAESQQSLHLHFCLSPWVGSLSLVSS